MTAPTRRRPKKGDRVRVRVVVATLAASPAAQIVRAEDVEGVVLARRAGKLTVRTDDGATREVQEYAAKVLS
jgi:ACT domain-containing protein